MYIHTTNTAARMNEGQGCEHRDELKTTNWMITALYRSDSSQLGGSGYCMTRPLNRTETAM